MLNTPRCRHLLLWSWLILWLSVCVPLMPSGAPTGAAARLDNLLFDSHSPATARDEGLRLFPETQPTSLNSDGVASSLDAGSWIWDEYIGAPGDLSGDDVVHWGPSLGPFHNYSETVARLEALSDQFPDYLTLTVIGQSYQGRSIWRARVTAPGDTTNRPGFLVVAQHHAREPITIENALYLLDYLLAYRTDPTVARILQNFIVYVIPSLNPDALAILHQNPWQRKNLRPIDDDGDHKLVDEGEVRDINGNFLVEYLGDDNFEGIDIDHDGRTGEDFAGGVDLNRNYPVAWAQGSTDVRSEIYRGTTPFSENETQAMRNFAIACGDTLAFALSLHSGIEVFLTPWSHTNVPSPDEPFFARLGTQVAAVSGYEWWTATQLYPSYGAWDDWLYGDYGVPAATLETYGNESAYSIWDYFNPPANRVIGVCQRVWQAFVAIAQALLSIPPSPIVTVSSIVPSAVPTTIWVAAEDSLSGIKQVLIRYTFDGSTWTTVNATHQGGTRYWAVVSASVMGGPVTVQALARDYVGHEAWSAPVTYVTSLVVTIVIGVCVIAIALVISWFVLRRARGKEWRKKPYWERYPRASAQQHLQEAPGCPRVARHS